MDETGCTASSVSTCAMPSLIHNRNVTVSKNKRELIANLFAFYGTETIADGIKIFLLSGGVPHRSIIGCSKLLLGEVEIRKNSAVRKTALGTVSIAHYTHVCTQSLCHTCNGFRLKFKNCFVFLVFRFIRCETQGPCFVNSFPSRSAPCSSASFLRSPPAYLSFKGTGPSHQPFVTRVVAIVRTL